MNYFWYDKDGKPLETTDDYNTSQWKKEHNLIEKLLTNRKYKIIKQEYTPKKKFWISTVWLGIDHDFGWRGGVPNPHPLIFETMQFRKDHKENYYINNDMNRYHTTEQALLGHQKMLRKWTGIEKRMK